ncbi:hypothetical protein PEp14_0005 [Erwinia phage PEp14]|uniref:Uncharacterized protein n=1 Tax=Erwinia phage PEp14 TaxID=1131315 RepID=H2DE35_9CAUD|nr:hypothetical protein PEp14_0005 [Erwinia phage PEp14]AEY69594.1 hypothetical protein PEp14_0005 [Erwinia phage PEp14]
MSLPAVKIRSFTGSSSFTRGGSVPVIDLLTPALDRRLMFTGPAHSYVAKDGSLKQSAVNEWPLEFRDGVPVGRHEPEPATSNLITDPVFANIVNTTQSNDGKWSAYGGGLGTVQANTGINGGPAFNTTAGYSKGGVYDGSAFVVPDTADWQQQAFANGWQRIKMQGRFSADSPQSRFYIARQDSVNFIYFTLSVPAGEATFTEFRLPWQGANSNFRHSWPQAERGTLATSPVIGNRAASSVYVRREGGAKGVRLIYSDGTKTELAFGALNALPLPIASQDWAKRYLTRIEYF